MRIIFYPTSYCYRTKLLLPIVVLVSTFYDLFMMRLRSGSLRSGVSQEPVLSGQGLSGQEPVLSGQEPVLSSQELVLSGQEPVLSGQGLSGQGSLRSGTGSLRTGTSSLRRGFSQVRNRFSQVRNRFSQVRNRFSQVRVLSGHGSQAVGRCYSVCTLCHVFLLHH